MIKSVRSLRLAQKPPRLLSFLPFQKARFIQSRPEQDMDEKKAEDMDEKKAVDRNHDDKTGDVMSHSFGEGYATRSDEEGFGGIYGGNSSDQSRKDPDYDIKQGSEVSDKEKGRNQKKGDH